MNALILANFPLAALIFAAIVGIPLWLTFKRPDRAPRYSQAAAVPTTVAQATPVRGVPSRTAAPRVSMARQHAAARTAVPGRQHAAATAVTRSHPAQRDHVSA